MDSIHDGEAASAVGMDSDVPQHGLGSHPDTPLSQNSSHMSSLFPNEPGASDTMSSPMHVSESVAPPMNIDPMQTLHSTSSERASAPGFIPDFPPRNGLFNVDDNMGLPLTMHSSPSVSTVSSNPSHAASPAVNGMGSAFTVGTSSLASALDSLTVPVHHQPESSVSPGNLANSMTNLGFSSGHSTSNPDGAFQFPPTSFESSTPGLKEGSPDIPPGGPHLMVVGDILKNIAQTANSASHACSRGHSDVANLRIDELKKTIALVSELIAATRLADVPSPLSGQISPHDQPSMGSVPVHLSPPVGSGLADQSPQLSTPPSQFTSPASQFTSPPSSLFPSTPMDLQNGMDGSDSSRKRCASSMAGDRVMKALKMTKQEDTATHIPPPPGHPPLSTSQIISNTPSPPSGAPSSALVDSFVPSNPPSQPASRPASSAGMMPHHELNLLQQQPPHPSLAYPLHMHLTPTSNSIPADFSVPPTPTHMTPPTFSSPPVVWPDGANSFHRQHSHSLPGGNIDGGTNLQGLGIAGPSSSPHHFMTSPSFASTPATSHMVPVAGPLPNVSMAPSRPPLPRQSRSLSINHAAPFAFGLVDTTIPELQDRLQSRPTTSVSASQSPGSSSQEYDNDGEYDYDSDCSWDHFQSQSPSSGTGSRKRTRDDLGVAASGDGFGGLQGTDYGSHNHSLLSQSSIENIAGGTSSSHANEMPQEYKADVDRIFFEFLNSICSNLDATDAKGEPIHQTLMAKKMQRLDESPDYRPFKFRIQAFTNAFLEDLAKQGYPEEKIPMKKVRNYLWNQPYISRFNEDGKKAKSKGNHIWNIDAKKAAEGGWLFRPFHRRLAGMPPGVAYVGLRWSWTPRIWDPQGSRLNLPVHYSSPWLPHWLSWNDDVLSGTPPLDAQSSDVTIEARFIQDGKEEFLSQTVHVTIAPMSSVDTNFPTSRRPSLVDSSRRVASDSVVPQSTPARSRRQSLLAQATPHVTQDSQVVQVLTTAAQMVAQEAQSQVVAARTLNDPGPELQSLAKQQHVLTVTAQALDKEFSAPESASQPSSVLAAAAHQVVFQAARQVAADKSATVASQISAGLPPTPASTAQVTVTDVSMVTQTAVAQAVGMIGHLSSEVDVLMTANSLLQQQTRATISGPSGTLDPSQLASLNHSRPHSTGNLSPQAYPPPPISATGLHASLVFPPLLQPGMDYVPRP